MIVRRHGVDCNINKNWAVEWALDADPIRWSVYKKYSSFQSMLQAFEDLQKNERSFKFIYRMVKIIYEGETPYYSEEIDPIILQRSDKLKRILNI